jgi:hypothetical protein
MTQFVLDKVEQEILNARACAAIGHPKDACFHLAQAIEMLRKEVQNPPDKQPAPEVGQPPSFRFGPFDMGEPKVTEYPNGYMAGSKASPVTHSGSMLRHAWGQTVNLPTPEEQHAENQRALGMMNSLVHPENHNLAVRITVDKLRCLCEDLVRSERIVHPSYPGVNGSGDAKALKTVRDQIEGAQAHLNKLEPENRAIAAFNERIAKLIDALLYRREIAERARNSKDCYPAIDRERVIDYRLHQVTNFVATDWGEVEREKPKRNGVINLMRAIFAKEDLDGPNWYKRFSSRPGPLL